MFAEKRGQVDSLSISSPNANGQCTSDCLLNNPECGYEPEQCSCDQYPPREDGYCPAETKGVSYTVSEATVNLAGVWECSSYSQSSDTFNLQVYSECL